MLCKSAQAAEAAAAAGSTAAGSPWAQSPGRRPQGPQAAALAMQQPSYTAKVRGYTCLHAFAGACHVMLAFHLGITCPHLPLLPCSQCVVNGQLDNQFYHRHQAKTAKMSNVPPGR